MNVQELESAVLNLPSHERARLAELLTASLDEIGEVEAAWAEEAERRYGELRTGVVESVPVEEVMARLMARLR